MSLATTTPSEATAAKPVRTRNESVAGVLLRLGAFVLVFMAATHWLLAGNRAFLDVCRDRATTDASQPLRIEAGLRLLRPGEATVILTGSSVVDFNVDGVALADFLRLPAGGLVSVPLYGGTPVDGAMLAPLLARARPHVVVYPVTLWTLFDDPGAKGLRLYDPAMAWSLFTWRDLMHERQTHASHLLGSLHFAVRHRASLRWMLGRWAGRRAGLEADWRRPVFLGQAELARFPARARARREQFTCPSQGTRALGALARRLSEDGVLLAVVAMPANTTWDRDPELVRRLDVCLAHLADTHRAVAIPRSVLPAFGPSEFLDTLHMNPQGRQRFTEAVAPHLAPILGARPTGDAVR